MIAVDTNILVHAYRGDSPFHERASVTVKELAEGRERWAIPWPCLHEFLSVCTHPRVFEPPSDPEHAIEQISAWRESPSVLLLAEAEGYLGALRAMVVPKHIRGPRIHDARIAALCLHHGVNELLSADRDFSRFPELRVRNPLL